MKQTWDSKNGTYKYLIHLIQKFAFESEQYGVILTGISELA
jgi:hypothetical protein